MADYCEHEHYMNQPWDTRWLRSAKSCEKPCVLAFVYMLLMSGCTEMKPVSAAV